MKERLTGSDYRFIAICLVLLAGTVWFSARNFYKAFPEASIDFKVNRDGAQKLAGEFLSAQGYHVEGFRTAGQFDFDDDAKTFLEREAGLEQANRLMGSRVRLWRWKHRWFRPLQKEEFEVEITPRGEMAGFEHQLSEEAARPAISAEQARVLAEDFLRTRMGRDPATLDFVEESDVARPNRMDRTFTWKERDFEVKGATYRISVTTLGNEVGEYREYLKVPEQWKRDYERLRSKNDVAQAVDSVFMVLLIVALVVVIVRRVPRHDVRWRRAAWVGVAGIVLGFLSQLNEFPLHEYAYPTTDSYSSFLARQFLNAILAALGTGGFLFVLTAGAEAMYREAFPAKVSLGSLMSARGLRTKYFFQGTILGITLTGIFIAYQTAFYILAYQQGAWSPADVPYSDLVNTKFPWAFVLFGGFFPAVFEEFTFRMFAIPFLRKVTRSVAIAVVLAGFIWGFGHSSYPQQPFYIRGVEVGIGGVALGLVMLRFGILPTLVWHYSVDAMYSAMLLMRSSSLYYKLSGLGAAGIMVLPVVIALAAYVRKGGFEPAAGLLNRDDVGEELPPSPTETEEEAPPQTVPYQPLGRRARWVAVALLLAGVMSLALPADRFGDRPKFRIGAEAARQSAERFLAANGFDASGFRNVVYPAVHWANEDELAAKYFVRRMPLAAASALFERNRPVNHWMTRFFRPLDEEEAQVSVHPETGRPMGWDHSVPEDAPGANLPVEQAQSLAQQFAAKHGWNVAAMDLKESSSEKKKARTDSTFEWEARPRDPRNVGEAKFRVAVDVSGDRVSGIRTFWKTPEDFDRSREASNAVSIGVGLLRIIAIAGLIVYALWLLIQSTRQGLVPWSTALKVAVPAALLIPVAPLLSLAQLYKDYDTAKPLATFQLEAFVQQTISLVGGFLMLVIAAALIVTYYPRVTEELRRGNRRALGLDAAVGLIAAVGIGLLYRQVSGALVSRFHAQAILDASVPNLIGVSAPSVAAIAGAAHSAITMGAVLTLLALIVEQVKSRWKLVVAAAVLLCALVPNDVRTAGEFALEYVLALLLAVAVIAFCWYFARKNYLTYVLMVWLVALRGGVTELLGNGNPSLSAHGWIVGAVMAASILWAVGPGLGRHIRPQVNAEEPA